MAGAVLVALALAGCGGRAAGDAFLHRAGLPAVSQEVGPELDGALAAEVEEALGLGGASWRAAEGRAVHIKEALRPTFASMPKNEHGKLGHAAVRYVLHRLFVSRHGWFIQGLHAEGEGGAEGGGGSGLLHDQVPEHVQSLFERRVGQHGLGLEELTVLAATLEHLVHNEVSNHLNATFRLFGAGGDESVQGEKALEMLDAYMAVYIFGGNISGMPATHVRSLMRNIGQMYPTWPHTQEWVRGVYNETVPSSRRSGMGFGDVVGVAEQVGERYGRWQNAECLDLKRKLEGYGDASTGRVRLVDFYSGAVRDGQWQFSESVAYLRELGALDESDAANPRVIIPNYINSPSNCVASSSYYSVCCINECEDLLGHLEEQVGAPEARPSQLSALVAALPSATRQAGRTLPAPLLARLDEVAEHHGGRVPLHGRLFAQWLHLAYPMECPFPHVAGAVNAVRAVQFTKATGHSATLNETEIRQQIREAPEPSADAGAEEGVCSIATCGMWTMKEELIAGPAVAPAARGRHGAASALVRGVLGLAAVVSSGLAVLRTAGSACGAASIDKLDKFV
ncbi:unnamed protein product [Prorocentrum cordatum]|uniref:Phospholipase B-like n=1 Tax=Prorocentrum cordatum TaxID=2364126 RepID=A0ABN9WK05_9DINO|nr:unnamed protein product [Polarella glacialis]